MLLNCPTCDARWPVGTHVGEFERQNLEQAPCPLCGKHTLRCVAVNRKSGRKGWRSAGNGVESASRP